MKITSTRFGSCDSLDIELRDMNIVCFFFPLKEWRLGTWRFLNFKNEIVIYTPWCNIYIYN